MVEKVARPFREPISYPIKEYEADIRNATAFALDCNGMDPYPSRKFVIKRKNGSEIKVNFPGGPRNWFQEYFDQKYGPDVGFSRGVAVLLIIEFIKKHRKRLTEAGLLYFDEEGREIRSLLIPERLLMLSMETVSGASKKTLAFVLKGLKMTKNAK